MKLGKNLCPQRVGVYNNVEEVDLEKIIKMGNVVLKVSNGFNDNIFITEKNNNIEKIKSDLIFHFNRDYPLRIPSFFQFCPKPLFFFFCPITLKAVLSPGDCTGSSSPGNECPDMSIYKSAAYLPVCMPCRFCPVLCKKTYGLASVIWYTDRAIQKNG